MSDRIRIDQWLWAARLYKTRSLAKTAVDGGRVHLNGQRIKPSHIVRVGDEIQATRAGYPATLKVMALSKRRASAAIAQTLYEETAASIEARESEIAIRRMQRAGLTVPASRPDKHQRRALKNLKLSTPDIPGEEA